MVAADPHAVYMPPFDHPKVVEGNATLIHEIKEQLEELGETREPDAVLTCVGGGGLMAGVLKGMDDVGWNKARVVGTETYGASSLWAALKASFKEGGVIEPTLASLPAITSIATSLVSISLERSVGTTNTDGA